MTAMGCAHLMAKEYGEALNWTRRALRERPTFGPALRFHAASLAELGRLNEASREIIARLLKTGAKLDGSARSSAPQRPEAHGLIG
jgi:Flp pilus assembly protein TadD